MPPPAFLSLQCAETLHLDGDGRVRRLSCTLAAVAVPAPPLVLKHHPHLGVAVGAFLLLEDAACNYVFEARPLFRRGPRCCSCVALIFFSFVRTLG
jgi:hypothetical protein